jgi:hypothetical protein
MVGLYIVRGGDDIIPCPWCMITTCNNGSFCKERGETTGRQLLPLSSVLYRIISNRRYILAAQLLLREKSGT